MKLFLASLFTLLLLFSFLGTVVFAYLYITGTVNTLMFFVLVIILNFLLWLVSPKISDFIYRYFFKMRWITMEELREKSPGAVEIIESVCRKYRFNIPKLGIIPDKNPNAFTYGSGRWNARIIATEGIFKYLDDDNIKAVYGHELGHIKNRDFIVMTVANSIIQLLYALYVTARESVEKKGSRSKNSGAILFVGLLAFIFYWIGQYFVLFLSRTREYYADQFSAEETRNPDSLSIALIRIAYGILTNPDDVKLVKTTKNIGIVNFAASKSVGMYYHMSYENKNPELLEKAFLYDIKNPWAKIFEISSTHPLTGKRIRRLSELCKKLGTVSRFDFERIERSHNVSTGKLYKNFFKDIFAMGLPFIFLAGVITFYIYSFLSGFITISLPAITSFFALLFISVGAGNILKTLYRYPGGTPQQATIEELMGDIYASPVRGRHVVINGKFIGKGIPGFIFSEDIMMQDKTGLIYLNYESWFPLLGNLFFALKKVKKLIGTAAAAEGWFIRGATQRIDINKLKTPSKTIKSYIKLIGLFWGFFFIFVGLYIISWFGFVF